MPKLVTVRLDLKIPGLGGIQGTWEPDESEAGAAWELYVGMVTRTPLGDLPSHEGSPREAMSSIYSLFDTTRSILRQYGPSVARPKKESELSFGYLAVSMLNLVLRQLLTEWHGRLRMWEDANPGLREDEWPDLGEFRIALDLAREQLRLYARLFADVAEVPELLGESYDTDSQA